jgi:isopropylmalate/homocitrate/citramalate synthase
MILPRTVQVVEVGPRDGFQMEKTFIATETKLKS